MVHVGVYHRCLLPTTIAQVVKQDIKSSTTLVAYSAHWFSKVRWTELTKEVKKLTVHFHNLTSLKL